MERYPLIKKSSILDVPQGFEYISAKVVFLILFLLSLTERKDLSQRLLMTHNSFAKAGAILVGNSVILLIVSDSIRLRECYLLKKQFEYVQ